MNFGMNIVNGPMNINRFIPNPHTIISKSLSSLNNSIDGRTVK